MFRNLANRNKEDPDKAQADYSGSTGYDEKLAKLLQKSDICSGSILPQISKVKAL